jgi:hypothetical protein
MRPRAFLRRTKRQNRSISPSGAKCARPVEVLEARRLLSATVSAAQLNPPLDAGVSWTYQLSGGIVGTETQTVIGPATFNGISATEMDTLNNFTSPSSVMSAVRNYVAFTSEGLVEYGMVILNSNVTVTETNSPALIEFPATLTVGTPVIQSVSQTSTSQPGGSTMNSSEMITLTLASGTPQSITVPAGTYNAYEMDNSTVGTGGGTIQSWFAPNVGLVKAIIQTGAQPVTEELTAFMGPSGGGGGGGGGGGSGTGTVSSSLKGALPASIVATTPLNLKNSLTLTASAAVNGAVSESILLSPDTNASDSVFTLSSGHTSLKLASGKSKSLALKFAKMIPSSVAPGTYNVLVVTTDAAGTVQSTAGQLTIVAPTVDITGSIVKAPTTVKAGATAPLTFTISNSSSANVAAVGTIQIQFDTSADGLLSDATTVASTSKRLNLKPGKSMKVTFSVTLSKTGFVLVNLDPGNAVFKNDANLANNVFATSQAITVS